MNDENPDAKGMASQEDPRREAWQQAVAINLEKIEHMEHASDRAALLLETAEILENKLNDPHQAFGALLRAFWEIPTKQKTRDELARLADLTQRWHDVYSTAVSALEKTPGRTAHILLLLQLGDWCVSKLELLDQALIYYSQVLQIDPTNIEAYRNIAELYETSEQWNDLATALGVAAANCSDPDETKKFLLVRGRVLEEYANDLDEACASYEQACEIDPKFTIVLDSLDRIYTKKEDWYPLLAILDRKVDAATKDEDKIDLLMRKGQLKTVIGDYESAVDTYHEVLRIRDDYLPAFEALKDTYRAGGQMTKLRDALAKQVEACTDNEKRLRLLVDLATLLEDSLYDPDKAADAWMRVLDLKPEDQTALDALIRIYRQRQRFDELKSVLKKAIESRRGDPEVKELHLELGQVLLGRLDQAEEAEETFREILENGPCIEALEGLAIAQENLKKWSSAELTLKKLLELKDGDAAKEEINFRLGALVVAKGEDPQQAIEYYNRILETNPTHRAALQNLRLLYLESEALEEAAKVLESEFELEESPKKKASLASDLGLLCRRQDRGDDARRWFERALQIDEFNAVAAKEMSQLHLAETSFDRAESLLEMLIRTEAAADTQEHRAFLLELSRIYVHQKKNDEAFETAQKAYQLDPRKLDSQIALGQALFHKEQWEKALPMYQKFIARIKKETDDEYESLLLFQYAVILYHLKKSKSALSALQKALELSPRHRPSLELIIKLNVDEKNYKKAVERQKQLAACLAGEERFEILLEIARIATEELGDHYEAIEAYKQAIAIKPDDRPTLHKLLPHYQATDQWSAMVDLIWRIIETESDPHRSARLYKSMGIVYREKLDQIDQAILCFNSALDADPSDRDVFDTLLKLLIQMGDWEKIENAYREMISRIKDTDERERQVELWHSLGEILLYKANRFQSAAEAFASANALGSHDPKRQELIASCLFNIPERFDDAILEYRRLIASEPKNASHYKHLGSLLAGHGRLDEAWNVSAALVALGDANEKEKEFYKSRVPQAKAPSISRLNEQQLSSLLSHDDDDPVIAEVFSIVTRAIISPKDQPLKAYGLKKRYKVSENDDAQIAQTYYQTAYRLGLTNIPELYVKPDDQTPLCYTVSEPARSVVGEAYLSGYPSADLLFITTKHLAYSRPGRCIRWLVTNKKELKLVLLAAMKLGFPAFNSPLTDSPNFATYVQNLNELLTEEETYALREPAAALANRFEALSITNWIAGLEHTACRLALLMSGDLQEAVKLAKAHHFVTSGPSIKAITYDLLSYGVSKEYAQLRAQAIPR